MPLSRITGRNIGKIRLCFLRGRAFREYGAQSLRGQFQVEHTRRCDDELTPAGSSTSLETVFRLVVVYRRPSPVSFQPNQGERFDGGLLADRRRASWATRTRRLCHNNRLAHFDRLLGQRPDLSPIVFTCQAWVADQLARVDSRQARQPLEDRGVRRGSYGIRQFRCSPGDFLQFAFDLPRRGTFYPPELQRGEISSSPLPGEIHSLAQLTGIDGPSRCKRRRDRRDTHVRFREGPQSTAPKSSR